MNVTDDRDGFLHSPQVLRITATPVALSVFGVGWLRQIFKTLKCVDTAFSGIFEGLEILDQNHPGEVSTEGAVSTEAAVSTEDFLDADGTIREFNFLWLIIDRPKTTRTVV